MSTISDALINQEGISPGDREYLNSLKNQISQNSEGLAYTLGLKKPEVRSFYDDHPFEAAISDITSKPVFTGALAMGGTLIADEVRKQLAATKHIKSILDKYPLPDANPKTDSRAFRVWRERVRADNELKPQVRSWFGTYDSETVSEEAIAKALKRHKNVTSSYPTLLQRAWKSRGANIRKPALIGGSVAIGGLALGGLLKLIQSIRYPKQQKDEWREAAKIRAKRLRAQDHAASANMITQLAQKPSFTGK